MKWVFLSLGPLWTHSKVGKLAESLHDWIRIKLQLFINERITDCLYACTPISTPIQQFASSFVYWGLSL